MLCCFLRVDSSTATRAGAPSRTATPTPALVSSASESAVVASTSVPSKTGNVAGQLVGYVKTSVTKTVDGIGQLWSNHSKCNDIRKKIGAYREHLKLEWEEQGQDITSERKHLLKTKVGGITFEEYTFLQKGKEDRGKVMNLLFLMWGAPKILPYALLFNPDMLPSPFLSHDDSTQGGESIWAKQSRERSAAVIQALLKLEKDAKVTPALAKINIFGKKKQEEQKSQLTQLVRRAGEYMHKWPSVNASHVLSQLDLYRADTDFGRAEKRLCGVPKTIVAGLSGVLGGGTGLLSSLQPHFMTRGRVVGHVTKVTESDDFLVSSKVDLTSINRRLLQEACSERMIAAGPKSTTDEMRQDLEEWLDLAVRQPDARLVQHAIANNGSVSYYNGNLARMALMAYYSCLAARDDRSTLQLPRLLYSGSSPLPSPSKLQKKEASKVKRPRRHFLSFIKANKLAL